jgi:hypothetical protein
MLCSARRTPTTHFTTHVTTNVTTDVGDEFDGHTTETGVFQPELCRLFLEHGQALA